MAAWGWKTLSASSYTSDSRQTPFPMLSRKMATPTILPRSPGFIGELQRQGELMEEASSDVFDPPADGELTEDQVETYAANSA